MVVSSGAKKMLSREKTTAVSCPRALVKEITSRRLRDASNVNYARASFPPE